MFNSKKPGGDPFRPPVYSTPEVRGNADTTLFGRFKAMRSGDIPRATEIQSAKSALDAKKIGNMVTPSTSFTDNQVTLMTEIIEAKALQVPSFSEFLKNSKKPTVFVETTYDNFWASGLDFTGTYHTNPKEHPWCYHCRNSVSCSISSLFKVCVGIQNNTR